MAVEKSVFINNDQINAFLTQNYGFENNEIFRIKEVQIAIKSKINTVNFF